MFPYPFIYTLCVTTLVNIAHLVMFGKYLKKDCYSKHEQYFCLNFLSLLLFSMYLQKCKIMCTLLMCMHESKPSHLEPNQSDPGIKESFFEMYRNTICCNCHWWVSQSLLIIVPKQTNHLIFILLHFEFRIGISIIVTFSAIFILDLDETMVINKVPNFRWK